MMSWLKKKVFPSDPNPVCGYGPFSLPEDHPFTRACVLHDHEFQLAEQGLTEKTLAEADAELFFRWTLIANSQVMIEDKIRLMGEICKYWPLARKVGWILWDGEK